MSNVVHVAASVAADEALEKPESSNVSGRGSEMKTGAERINFVVRAGCWAVFFLAIASFVWPTNLSFVASLHNLGFSALSILAVLLQFGELVALFVAAILAAIAIHGASKRRPQSKYKTCCRVGVLSVFLLFVSGFFVYGGLGEKGLFVSCMVVATITLHGHLVTSKISKPQVTGHPILAIMIVSFAGLYSFYVFFALFADHVLWDYFVRWINARYSDPVLVASFLMTSFFFGIGFCSALLVGVFFLRARLKVRLIRVAASFFGGGAMLLILQPNLNSQMSTLMGIGSVFLVALAADFLSEIKIEILPDSRWLPRGIVRFATILFCASVLITAHTLSFKTFGLMGKPLPGYLTRIDKKAEPIKTEVFEVVLDDAGERLLLVNRHDGQLFLKDLRVDSRAMEVDLSAIKGPERDKTGSKTGTFEKALYLPEKEVFVVTYQPKNEHSEESSQPALSNMVVVIDPRARKVVRVLNTPDLGWQSSIKWNARNSQIFLGYEGGRWLAVVDFETGQTVTMKKFDWIGDTQDIAIDYSDDEFFTLPLRFDTDVHVWDLEKVEEIDQIPVGGGSYDMAFAPVNDLLFISRFWESRVLIIDTAKRQRIGDFKTDLGTRPVALDEKRKLVFAASRAGGRIHVFDYGLMEPVGSFPTCSRVKKIAVDSTHGVVYFASLCGTFQFDTEKFLEWEIRAPL